NTSLSIDNYRKLPANNNVSGSSQTTGTRNRSTGSSLLHCASHSPLSPLAFSGPALLPLVAPYPFRPFPFTGAIISKIVVVLHQKPVNRLNHP
ncbi:hypothetical protein ACFDZU_004640, partial [Salmonella enterica]